MNPSFRYLVVLVALLSFSVARPQILNVMNTVSSDSLLQSVKELSGALPIFIDGRQHIINTRQVLTTGNRLATRYIGEKFKTYGLSVQQVPFYSDFSSLNVKLNFIELTSFGQTLWMCSDWGEVFFSTDSGETWISRRQSGTPQTDRLDWICVGDSTTLVALGKSGLQTITTDGGITWTTKSSGLSDLVYATTNGNIFISVGRKGLIWRSTAQDSLWSKQNIDTTIFLNQVEFINRSHILAVGSDTILSTGKLFESLDKGISWRPLILPSASPLNALCSTDSLHIWIAASRGILYKSTSAGQTWTIFRFADSTNNAKHIFFCDSLAGWILTTTNKFYLTTNGGSSWEFLINFATSLTVQDFHFFNPLRGILIGQTYSNYMTTNGGLTWQDKTIPLLSNTIATLRGRTNPNQYLLVTAHSDCTINQEMYGGNRYLFAPGADDDASGVAGLFELARTFSQYSLPLTIKFAAIPDEEEGCGGNVELAKKLLAETDTLLVAIDFDMIGYDGLYPRTMSLYYLDNYVSTSPIANRFVKVVNDYQIGLTVVHSKASVSNLGGFYKYPSIGIADGAGLGTRTNPNYHKVNDIWSTLDSIYFRDVVRTTAGFLYDLAINGINEVESSLNIPLQFVLQQNYPNPFNTSTSIQYILPYDSKVQIHLYNTLGQLVKVLVDGKNLPGYYRTHWNADVPSGIYFYRMEAVSLENPERKFSATKKMLLVR